MYEIALILRLSLSVQGERAGRIQTGAVSELDANVRVREGVEGYCEAQLLGPGGAVVVVQHQRLVARRARAARAPHALLATT